MPACGAGGDLLGGRSRGGGCAAGGIWANRGGDGGVTGAADILSGPLMRDHRGGGGGGGGGTGTAGALAATRAVRRTARVPTVPLATVAVRGGMATGGATLAVGRAAAGLGTLVPALPLRAVGGMMGWAAAGCPISPVPRVLLSVAAVGGGGWPRQSGQWVGRLPAAQAAWCPELHWRPGWSGGWPQLEQEPGMLPGLTAWRQLAAEAAACPGCRWQPLLQCTLWVCVCMGVCVCV